MLKMAAKQVSKINLYKISSGGKNIFIGTQFFFPRQKLPCYTVEKTKILRCLTILELYLNYTWYGLTTEEERTCGGGRVKEKI